MLMIRPRPNCEDDSLAGYLMFIAEKNGLFFQEWALSLGVPFYLFLSPTDVMYGRTSVHHFVEDIGLPNGALDDMVYKCDRWLRRPDVVSLNRHFTLPYTLMRGRASPICPQCMLENRLPNRRWDIVLNTRCAIHDLRLVDKCPHCELPLTWLRKQLARCDCERRLSSFPSRLDSESPADIADEHLMPVALLIAFHLAVQKGQMRLIDLRELSIDAMADIAARAHKAVLAGDDAVKHYLLDAMQGRVHTGGALGQRWLLLPAMLGLPQYEELSAWLLRLAESNMSQLHVEDSLAVDSITLNETATLLGVTTAWVTHLCKNNKLHRTSYNQGKQASRINANSVATYLRIEANAEPKPQQAPIPENLLTVAQVAERMAIYPYAIRRVIKVGLLKVQKGRSTQQLVEEVELARFQTQFIFVRELALRLNSNPTNLAERLQAVGVQPVSGPSIDGALIYLFNRADITDEVLSGVEQLVSYKTKTGRRKKGVQNELMSGYMTLQTVADSLGTTLLTVARLVTEKHLRASTPPDVHHNRYYIHQSDFDAYRLRYRANPEWLTLKDAALRMGISQSQLRRRHIDSSEMTAQSDGLQRYVKLSDVENAIKVQRELIVSAEAAKLLNRPRYMILNLVNSGQLKPVKGPTADLTKRYYFRREDIEALKFGG